MRMCDGGVNVYVHICCSRCIGETVLETTLHVCIFSRNVFYDFFSITHKMHVFCIKKERGCYIVLHSGASTQLSTHPLKRKTTLNYVSWGSTSSCQLPHLKFLPDSPNDKRCHWCFLVKDTTVPFQSNHAQGIAKQRIELLTVASSHPVAHRRHHSERMSPLLGVNLWSLRGSNLLYQTSR